MRISDVSFRVYLKQQRDCGLQEAWITEVFLNCSSKISVLQLQHVVCAGDLGDKDCPNTFHNVAGIWAIAATYFLQITTQAPSPLNSATFSVLSLVPGNLEILVHSWQKYNSLFISAVHEKNLQKSHLFLFYYKFLCLLVWVFFSGGGGQVGIKRWMKTLLQNCFRRKLGLQLY